MATSDSVTVLIKSATLLPPNSGAALPDMMLTTLRDADSAYSSDSQDKVDTQGAMRAETGPGNIGFMFTKRISIDKAARGSTKRLYFVFVAKGGGKEKLGEGRISLGDLVKHAEFATALKDQALVLKHAAQPCPLRVDLDLEGSLLNGGMLSLDVELLSATSTAAAKATKEGDQLEARVCLSANKILATRGLKTDSFCRVMLVLEGEVEHEVGRTEIVADSLSPEYNGYISFSYSVQAATATDSKTLLRFEICDPGANHASATPSKASGGKERRPSADFTVIGAAQKLLSEVHAEIDAGIGSGVAGVYRGAFTLKQKGELQKLIEAKEKENVGKYGTVFAVVERVVPSDDCVALIIGASKLYTNKLSMRPDPYVRMYRLFDVTKEELEKVGKDAEFYPDRCPVYASNYVKNTREASWSTTPIPFSLLANGKMDSRIVVEVRGQRRTRARAHLSLPRAGLSLPRARVSLARAHARAAAEPLLRRTATGAWPMAGVGRAVPGGGPSDRLVPPERGPAAHDGARRWPQGSDAADVRHGDQPHPAVDVWPDGRDR